MVFYDGPIYIEKTWFNGFQSVQDQYAAGALGFNPKNKFTSSIASNVTDLRFGFVDKVSCSSDFVHYCCCCLFVCCCFFVCFLLLFFFVFVFCFVSAYNYYRKIPVF